LSFDKKIVVRQFNLGTEKSEIEVNFLKIKGDDESRKVFEFFSNNSTENKAEYVNVAIGKRTGASGLNLLGDYIGQTEPPVSDQTEPPLSDQMEPCLSDETEPPF